MLLLMVLLSGVITLTGLSLWVIWKRRPRPMSVAPAAGPGPPAPDEVREFIHAALESLPTGRILFNAPNDAQVGIPEIIEVRIAESLGVDLSVVLKGRGDPTVENLIVGHLMKVRLNGEGFDIESLNSEEQVLLKDDFTQWTFRVNPVESGLQTLILRASAVIIFMTGCANVQRDIEVLEREIRVKIHLYHSPRLFVKEHWTWIVPGMIVPIGLFIWGWLR